jgi:RNA polymerase sigma factor (TIGR02999 family)
MSDLTRMLDAAAAGDRQASADMLPLVYDELRKLAAAKLASESPGHTLNATALVHEAYLRLVGQMDDNRWDGRGHFFASAAEAMRRILVDHARRRHRLCRGGDWKRIDLSEDIPADPVESDLLTVDEVIDQLAAHDPPSADLVKLHVFAGLSLDQAAEVLGISSRSAYRNWTYARGWIFRQFSEGSSAGE